MLAPEQKIVDSVKEWLAGFRIRLGRVSHSQIEGWLASNATTEEAENHFLTEYHLHEYISFGHMTLLR